VMNANSTFMDVNMVVLILLEATHVPAELAMN